MNTSPSISYEIFPPRTERGADSLANTLERLKTISPSLVSVTYGAGGADKDRSFAAVELAIGHAGCPVAAHLTCVGVPRREVDEVVDRYLALGVRHIVALRGDPPEGIDAPYQPHPEGFHNTAALVEAIHDRASAAGVEVTISVSAYPEVHPQSPDLEHDINVLKAKVAAGADRAMTQMFFRNEVMLAYRQALRDHGVDLEIVPGIMPVHNLERVRSFAERCGATVPAEMISHFDRSDDPRVAAVSWSAHQIQELWSNGFQHFHLYTLNQADLVIDIANALRGDQ